MICELSTNIEGVCRKSLLNPAQDLLAHGLVGQAVGPGQGGCVLILRLDPGDAEALGPLSPHRPPLGLDLLPAGGEIEFL